MPNRRLNNYLDSGYLVGNISHLYATSPPAKRVDNSNLRVNDVFNNISTGERGFWNGTYWLSTQYFINAYTVNNISASGLYNAVTQLIYPFNKNIFIENMEILYGADLTADANNYWQIIGDVATAFTAYQQNYSKQLNTNKTSGTVETITVNQATYILGGSVFRYQFGKIGTPTNLTANINLKMRVIL